MQKFSRTVFLACVAAVGVHVPIVAAYGATVGPVPHDGATVWTGTDPAELDAAQIGAIVGQPGLASFYEAGFGNARIATSAGEGQVVFTARQKGIAGHDVTVAIVDPGAANSPLSVSVAGRAITVSLATGSAGAVTSTAAQVVAAVNASPEAGNLVVVSAGGSGAGLAESLSATALAPVILEAASFAASYQTVFSSSASFPEDASIVHGGGAAIDANALFLYVRDTAADPAFYIYDLLASNYSWNGLDDLLLQGFWPAAGAIEQLKIVGVALTPTPVPEASSIALLALGLGVLGWGRRPHRRPG